MMYQLVTILQYRSILAIRHYVLTTTNKYWFSEFGVLGLYD